MLMFEVTNNKSEIEDILQQRLPQIKQHFEDKYGQPVGEGRNRIVYGSDRIVIKVPKNESGMSDNITEHSRYKQYGHHNELARARLTQVNDIPVLIMERLDTTNSDDKPDWADFYDLGQVGKRRRGGWRAYDYAD